MSIILTDMSKLTFKMCFQHWNKAEKHVIVVEMSHYDRNQSRKISVFLYDPYVLFLEFLFCRSWIFQGICFIWEGAVIGRIIWHKCTSQKFFFSYMRSQQLSASTIIICPIISIFNNYKLASYGIIAITAPFSKIN